MSVNLSGFFYLPPGQVGPPSPLLADNIDPKTHDFADLFTGVDPVDGAVQVAAMTTRGSGPCVLEIGVRLTKTKLSDDFQNATEADYRQALLDLERRRDIEIKSVTFGADGQGNATGTVNPSDQSAQINISYRNLRAYDAKVRSLQLSSRQV